MKKGKQRFRNLIIGILLLISNLCIGQDRYKNEINGLLKDILFDTTKFTECNFSRDIILDPPFTSTEKYCIDLKKKNYLKIICCDSLFGIKNPFKRIDIDSNNDAYILSIKNYSFDIIGTKVKRFKPKDDDRIFKIKYWKAFMDSTGHETRKLTKQENDSLFNLELSKDWDIFYSEFGKCYMSYEVPIFSKDFLYAYFEWSFSCGLKKGKGFKGLYKKVQSHWIPLNIIVLWSNEK